MRSFVDSMLVDLAEAVSQDFLNSDFEYLFLHLWLRGQWLRRHLSYPKALRSAVHERQRLRSQIVAPMTAAPKILVFSRPVALRSAVHERQQRLRSQLLLSSASDSDDSGSEDTCLRSASSSEVSCSRAPAAPKSAAFERQ